MEDMLLKLINERRFRSCAKRTPECPEEEYYWDFLDDEGLVPRNIAAHLITCDYCLHQMGITLDAQKKCSAPEKSELALLRERIPHPRDSSIRIVLQALKDSFKEVFNPLKTVEAYRSSKSGVLVLNEQKPNFAFNLEIHPLDIDGNIELIFELIKFRHRGIPNIEIWGNNSLISGFSLEIGKKRSLSKRKDNIYKIVLLNNSEILYDFEVVIL